MKDLSTKCHLGILKYKISLEGLFKNEISFNDYKRCFKPKVK